MLALTICIVAFFVCYFTTRRALWAGFSASLAAGYVYGIVRANIPNPAAQFLYDAAAAGFFCGVATRHVSAAERIKLRRLIFWAICLAGWPTMLLLAPSQPFMVQLVGWRGSVLFVPFILIGALITERDLRMLARALAVMNCAVLVVALSETIVGVPYFYPYNALDAIIYKSTDVYFGGVGHFRIPGTFTHAAAYATCMVSSLPLMMGALSIEPKRSWTRYLLLGACGASAIGVFLAASRSEAIVLILMVLMITLLGRYGGFPRMAWLAMIIAIAALVVLTPRMQRFFSLGDRDIVANRIHWSVNENFMDMMVDYPLGNGLGGGGTSMPYFLESEVQDPIGIENEYGRIMAEQGIPGLFLWASFILWVFVRANPSVRDPWYAGLWLARLFCAISFATAPLGTGLLNAIPQSAMLLMFTGWIATAGADERIRAFRPSRVPVRVSA